MSNSNSFYRKSPGPVISNKPGQKNYLNITNNNYTIINTALNNSININVNEEDKSGDKTFISQIPLNYQDKIDFNKIPNELLSNSSNTINIQIKSQLQDQDQKPNSETKEEETIPVEINKYKRGNL